MGMPEITPGGGTKCQAVTDMIESVALEQAALAHILNAEGEKIQKIASPEFGATPEQLLAVNKSVRDMVRAITNLEIVLEAKLQLFEDCLCGQCDCGGCDCGDCDCGEDCGEYLECRCGGDGSLE